MNWDECIKLARNINNHYSMEEETQKYIYTDVSQLPADAVVVEIGVAHGKTAAVIGYAAKENGFRYFGVDNFSLEGTKTEVVTDLHKIGLGQNMEIIEADAKNHKWSLPIDYLIIDGGHDEANIKGDCENWIKWVKPNGVAVFDDYGDQAGPHSGVTYWADYYTGKWQLLRLDGNTLFRRNI
jgi:predicted O-methyltransferase YrrM